MSITNLDTNINETKKFIIKSVDHFKVRLLNANTRQFRMLIFIFSFIRCLMQSIVDISTDFEKY